MARNVILITGTPGTGKTTVAKKLTLRLKGEYVNLTKLATKENLVRGMDTQRDTIIIDENRIKQRIRQIVKENPDKTVIIDGHYAPIVAPKQNTSYVFVLRRDPIELRKIMKKRSYPERKLSENLESEILDVCLVEALNAQPKATVCEIDTTQKRATQIVNEILAVMNQKSVCCVGIVDWLGRLENQGLLDEYLKI